MQELLKYQELDSKLRKLNGEIENNQNRKKANEMQQYMRETQSKISSLDESAAVLVANLNKLKTEYNAVISKIEQLSKVEAEKAEDLEKIENDLSKLYDALSKIEHDLANMQNKLVSVNKEFENYMKNAKTAKSNLVYYKQEFEKSKAEVAPKLDELGKALAEQKAKVGPELMSKYLAKAEGRIFPIFVPFVNDRCGGCHMEIPAGKIKELNAKHYIECENCGRYIYKV